MTSRSYCTRAAISQLHGTLGKAAKMPVGRLCLVPPHFPCKRQSSEADYGKSARQDLWLGLGETFDTGLSLPGK